MGKVLVKWDQVEEYMHIESAIWNQYLKDKAEDKAAEEDKNTEPIKINLCPRIRILARG